MRTWTDNLAADRVLEDAMNSIIPVEGVTGRTFTHPVTGAKLTYGASLKIIEHFCASLVSLPLRVYATVLTFQPLQNNQEKPKPHYIPSIEAGQYLYELILPENSPIRTAMGQRYQQKHVAKASAAFEMVIELVKRKYIDENLMSTFKKLLPAFRNAQLALHEKKGSKYPVRIKPSLWEQGRNTTPAQLYLTILDISDGLDRPYQPLGLLTRTPLPEFPQFPLFLDSGRVTTALAKGLEKPLDVNPGMVEQMAIFTHRLWKDINNKVFDFDPAKLSYWIVPITTKDQCLFFDEPEICIDWAAIITVNENEEFKWTPSTPNEFLEGKFVLDRDSGGGRFFFKRVEPSLTPLSPVPDGVVKPWGPGGRLRKDILDYSNSLWGKGRAHMRTIWNLDQPVFEAELIPLHQNMLAEPMKNRKQQDQKLNKVYLCPEPLRISAVSFFSWFIMAHPC
jgi:endoribonuclease Dicer